MESKWRDGCLRKDRARLAVVVAIMIYARLIDGLYAPNLNEPLDRNRLLPKRMRLGSLHRISLWEFGIQGQGTVSHHGPRDKPRF